MSSMAYFLGWLQVITSLFYTHNYLGWSSSGSYEETDKRGSSGIVDEADDNLFSSPCSELKPDICGLSLPNLHKYKKHSSCHKN